MKKTLFYAFTATILMGFNSSCSSDDDGENANTSAEEVTNTVTSGTWRITNFNEDGNDETSSFSGYNFDFGTTVLTASNSTNTYEGLWSVTEDDPDNSSDDNRSDDLDFNIVFSNPDSFTELNENWDIVERTNTKLRLRHTSGGDGSVDNLTFEKN